MFEVGEKLYVAQVTEVRAALNPVDRFQFDRARRATTLYSRARERSKTTVIAAVEPEKERQYIVLLVRPRSSIVARRLKKSIKDRGIDFGYELYEEGRPVQYEVDENPNKGT